MPAFENTYETGFNINSFFFCLRNILIAVISLLVASWSFGWVTQKYLYFQYYSFVPGQYTGYRLQQLAGLVPERTCLILGASTAREGFDLEKLEEKLPDLDFITLATTGPINSSTVIDIQASLLPKNKFACIIVGTHPFSIYTPDDQSYDLKSNNYFSQIPFLELIRMMRFDGDISIDELKLLGGIALVPNMRHSMILNEHLRDAFHDLKSVFSGGLSDIGISRFTNINEDKLPSHIRYKDERSKQMQSFVKRQTERIKSDDSESPLRYHSSGTNDALKMALKRLDNLTERLIILHLPETPVHEKRVKASFASFAKIVRTAVPDSEFYQCEFTFSDAYRGFVDTIHVNSEGRRHLTAEVIEILKGQSKDSTCSVPSNN